MYYVPTVGQFLRGSTSTGQQVSATLMPQSMHQSYVFQMPVKCQLTLAVASGTASLPCYMHAFMAEEWCIVQF
jgi:hypothetical protein